MIHISLNTNAKGFWEIIKNLEFLVVVSQKELKKDSQTDVVYIQKDFSLSQQREIIDRVKGKTTIKNIHTVMFENSDKSISIYSIKK